MKLKREIREVMIMADPENRVDGQNYISSKLSVKEQAAEMLADPSITTDQEIIDSIDVSRGTFYRWKNDQEFIDLVNSKIDKYTDRETAKVWKALIKEAQKGDPRSVKLFFEMKGKYKDRKEITGKDGNPIEIEESAKEKVKNIINTISERSGKDE